VKSASIHRHQMTERSTQWAFLALLGGALAIGFSPVLVRYSDVSPLSSAFFRVFLAVPLIAAFLWQAQPKASKQASGQYDAWLMVACGVAFAGDLICWHLAIEYTSIANSTLLANLATVFTPLMAWWLFGEQLSRLFLVGMAVALGGLVLLLGQSLKLGGHYWLGDLLAIITALFYTLYLLLVSRLRHRHSALKVLLGSSAVCAATLFPFALLWPGPLLPQSLWFWLVLLALSWVSHAAGQGLIIYSLAHLPAAYSIGLLLQPVVAALLAWWWFGEILTALQLAGAVVVLVGLGLSRWASVAPEKRRE